MRCAGSRREVRGRPEGSNRLHVDVTTPDLAALVDAGATLLQVQEPPIRWNVMADPDGNEFCAFVRPGAHS